MIYSDFFFFKKSYKVFLSLPWSRGGSRPSKVAKISFHLAKSLRSSMGIPRCSHAIWDVGSAHNSWKCLEYLQREVSRRHPDLIPESPEVDLFDVTEQWLYSQYLTVSRGICWFSQTISHPIKLQTLLFLRTQESAMLIVRFFGCVDSWESVNHCFLLFSFFTYYLTWRTTLQGQCRTGTIYSTQERLNSTSVALIRMEQSSQIQYIV